MKQYNKPPLTYKQQITLWVSRGLVVGDAVKAEECLQQINYYRLSGYVLPFQAVKDIFNKGATFEAILNLYLFDRELRVLVFDAIERIEIALKAQMIYQLAHKYGAHWQDNASVFNPASLHQKTRNTIDIYTDTQNIIFRHCNANHPEVFIKHYKNTYNIPVNPPSWMSIELLTIGELSRLYMALRKPADRKDIASFFGLHHTVFTSWLHTLVYIRNICAHHSRLWNREFAIKPDVLLRPYRPWIQPSFNNNNHRTFYSLSILKYLLFSSNPSNNFKEQLAALINKYPDTPIQFMGIPTDGNGKIINWQNENLWQ